MTEHHRATHVLHIDCPEGKVCPAVIDVEGLTGMKAVVGKVITDPTIAAALGQHIGPGEAALLITDDLYDQIRKGTP